jgi:hypothetical protein
MSSDHRKHWFSQGRRAADRASHATDIFTISRPDVAARLLHPGVISTCIPGVVRRVATAAERNADAIAVMFEEVKLGL